MSRSVCHGMQYAAAAGVVITLQSPAQGAGMRGLMRRAGVSPLLASVSPGSALLRSIAGPAAATAVLTASRATGRGTGLLLSPTSQATAWPHSSMGRNETGRTLAVAALGKGNTPAARWRWP